MTKSTPNRYRIGKEAQKNMANITSQISIIQQASRGEEVRDAIVSALTAMNNGIASSVESAVEDALEEARDSGDFDGPRGPAGANGTDGVSPTVTIEAITGGHRVTITDASHPNGQSFDVMDGSV